MILAIIILSLTALVLAVRLFAGMFVISERERRRACYDFVVSCEVAANKRILEPNESASQRRLRVLALSNKEFDQWYHSIIKELFND